MSGRYRHRPRISSETRFWRRVDTSADCWIWTGACDRDGYGIFNLLNEATPSGRPRIWIYAHRYAWTLTHGAIPNGLQVCHHCDNPPCVNDNHLFLGTNLDNVADRVRKLRGGTKLTEAKVRAILSDGRSNQLVALEYGVSARLVQRIRCGNLWRHVSAVHANVSA